jgi:hypothetical protein
MPHVDYNCFCKLFLSAAGFNFHWSHERSPHEVKAWEVVKSIPATSCSAHGTEIVQGQRHLVQLLPKETHTQSHTDGPSSSQRVGCGKPTWQTQGQAAWPFQHGLPSLSSFSPVVRDRDWIVAVAGCLGVPSAVI